MKERMRAHYLQHVPFEGLGSIAPWLEASGYEITSTRFFESAELPDPQAIDLLVILGGPMSVNDEGELPWLVPEKRFVREVMRAEIPVIGICLGAQLIASATGARVYRNPVKEIGWFPIQGVTSGDTSIFRFPPSEKVFHWHGETFDLPLGATRIAKSDGCENQAFQLGRSIGLQFHLETTPESAREIVLHCRDELIPSRYVQTAGEILSATPTNCKRINELMSRLLFFLTGNEG